MKNKNEMLSMLMAKLAEFKARPESANIETCKIAIGIKLAIEIRLLYDLLGEEVPEEYWDELEDI